MRLLVSILPLALAAGCGPRPPVRPGPDGHEAARPAHALPNGLALDVVPRPGTGVVALHLRLSAGAQHERPDAAGAAHAGLEAFLGDDEGLRADVRRMGGQIRGWVTRDATDIEIVVGKDQLGEALARIAARLGRLSVDEPAWRAIAPRLDDAQHLRRRDDTRRATEAVVADLYDGHALARAPLPDSAALGKLLPLQITAYLEARYRPDGARLVVVGDVDAGEVQREAADAFGPWSGKVAVVQHGAPTPPGELALRLLDTRAEKATLAIAFPADAAAPGDAAALDLLSALAEDRLNAGLRRAGVPAEAVRVFASTPEGGGFLLARCQVPATAIDASWQVLVTSVVAQAGVPTAPGAFDEARRRVQDAGQALDVEGEARWRAAVQGRWPEAPLGAWRAALDAATPPAVADKARGLLRLDRAAAVILAPDAVRTDDDGPWAARLMEQAFTLARPDAAPPPGVHKRGEGLTVVVHPMAGATAVGLVVRIEGGAAQVPAKRAGLAAMVAAALAEPVAGEPTFQARVGADHLLLSTEVLPTHLGAALDALERRLGQLAWTPARTEAARALALGALHHAATHGEARVEQLFLEAAGLPDALGTEAALGDLSPGAVRAWYQAHVREAALTIGVAGAVDTRIVSGLERRFARRRPATTHPLAPPPTGEPPTQRTLDAPESYAMLGYWWPAEGAGPALAATTLELATGPDGPLAEVLAGQRGTAAQPFLRLEAGRGLLGVRLLAPRDRFSSARTAAETAFDRLTAQPVDPERLAEVTRRLATQARVRLRAPVDRARWLVEQAVMGTSFTGADALDSWSRALTSLTPPMVAGFIRQTLLRSNRVEARVDGAAPVSP
ncbi:MAG: insulinase family protein [Myxococcales bacterium]|nr:insulinase family protein [Myxococcales bacterium]